MAQKRMFSLTVIDTDCFIDMPTSARLLYYELGMRADDDGFVSAPKKIVKMVGCSEDDLKLLISKSFVICFDSGVVVIRHWKINNYLRADRYKPTIYTQEREQLITDNEGIYNLSDSSGIPVGIPTHNQMDTQYSIDKISIDKISTDKDSVEASRLTLGKFNNVFLSKQELESLKQKFPEYYEDKIEHLSNYMQSNGISYRDHYAKLFDWLSKDTKNIPKRNASYSLEEFEKKASWIDDWEPDKKESENDEKTSRVEEVNLRCEDSEK